MTPHGIASPVTTFSKALRPISIQITPSTTQHIMPNLANVMTIELDGGGFESVILVCNYERHGVRFYFDLDWAIRHRIAVTLAGSQVTR